MRLAGVKHFPPPKLPSKALAPTKSSSQGREIRVEVRDRFDSAKIIFQRDVFIGRVGLFVRQSKSNQNAGYFESVMHLRNEGNGTAFANENSLFPKTFFQSTLRLLKNRRLKGSRPRLAGAKNFKFAGDRIRQQRADLFFDQLSNLVWILIRYKPGRKFCARLGGYNRFRTFAGVAPPDAIQLQCRARPKLLDNRVTLLAKITWSTNGLFKLFSFPGQSVKNLALCFGNWGHGIVEARHVNAEILVVKLGEKFGEDR